MGVIGTIYFVRSNRIFNNATTITNVIAITLLVIISVNILTDFSNGNFFGSPQLSPNEKFLGVGASENNLFQNMFQINENMSNESNNINTSDLINVSRPVYYTNLTLPTTPYV